MNENLHHGVWNFGFCMDDAMTFTDIQIHYEQRFICFVKYRYIINRTHFYLHGIFKSWCCRERERQKIEQKSWHFRENVKHANHFVWKSVHFHDAVEIRDSKRHSSLLTHIRVRAHWKEMIYFIFEQKVSRKCHRIFLVTMKPNHQHYLNCISAHMIKIKNEIS